MFEKRQYIIGPPPDGRPVAFDMRDLYPYPGAAPDLNRLIQGDEEADAVAAFVPHVGRVEFAARRRYRPAEPRH